MARALDFAASKHVHQRRKGILAEPYVNHLTDVARRLAEATQGTDVDLIIAGLLHDVMEDCGVRYEELSDLFGADVAALVKEVTDDISLPKSERKLKQVRFAASKSPRAKMLRLADKTSNLHSLLTSPPPHWDLTRRIAYFDWAKQVADNCRGVNPHLEAAFYETYQDRAKLGLNAA